jgi:uncharacterized protein affecting Mg2+/Co2+ transport
MSIKNALSNILEGNLDAMRQNFSFALTEKAVQKLEEKKINIAQNYFGQVMEEVEELDEKVIGRSKKGNVRVKSKGDGTGKIMSGKREITSYDDDSDDVRGGGVWSQPRKKKGEKGDKYHKSADDAAKYFAKRK